jgi:hypothetical protein
MIFALILLCGQIPFDETYQYLDAIDNLNNDKYAIREEATAFLMKAKERAIPTLLFKRDKVNDRLEVRMRIEGILDKYVDSILPTDSTELPWIDCLPILYPDRPVVLLKYQTPLDDEDYRYAPEFNIYRQDTKRLIKDLFIFQHISKEEIIEVLDKMIKNEKAWGYRAYKAQPDFAY